MELTKEYFDQHIKLTQEHFDEQSKLTKEHFEQNIKLTQEHFDEKFKNVATKQDLNNFVTKEYFEEHLDKKLAAQSVELKAHAEEQTAELAAMVAKTIANPMEIRFNKLEKKFPIVERVHAVETDMRKIKTALHLS